MAKALVICKYCGIQFDRNAEPFEDVGSRRYAHKSCADRYNNSISQDEKDYNELEKYIKKLFKVDTISVKIRKQIKDFHKDYSYTYSGMLKTLYWWFEIKKNSIEDAQNGIGIIPWVYNDALKYYYTIYIANSMVQEYRPEVKEVTIGSPRVRQESIKLFNLDK